MGKRISRCVELLEQDQAIYYDGPHSGHVLTPAQGRIDAGTWADYMNVGMEHGSFDMAGLADYMRGMVDAGPTRRGTARRRSSSRRPFNGIDAAHCVTTPGSSARSSAAACMASCSARRKPPMRCAGARIRKPLGAGASRFSPMTQSGHWHRQPKMRSAALFYPVARVTTHALSGYLRKPRKHRLQIAGDTRLLSRNCKPTCRTVHRRAGILHSLRHIFGNLRSAVQPQR